MASEGSAGRGPRHAAHRQGATPTCKEDDMFNVVKKSIEWGHDTLTLETGKIARQADGRVIAT